KRAGNQSRISVKVLVDPDIDEHGCIWRADQARQLFGRNGLKRRHDASSLETGMGRDAWACRLVGRPLSPWADIELIARGKSTCPSLGDGRRRDGESQRVCSVW